MGFVCPGVSLFCCSSLLWRLCSAFAASIVERISTSNFEFDPSESLIDFALPSLHAPFRPGKRRATRGKLTIHREGPWLDSREIRPIQLAMHLAESIRSLSQSFHLTPEGLAAVDALEKRDAATEWRRIHLQCIVFHSILPVLFGLIAFIPDVSRDDLFWFILVRRCATPPRVVAVLDRMKERQLAEPERRWADSVFGSPDLGDRSRVSRRGHVSSRARRTSARTSGPPAYIAQDTMRKDNTACPNRVGLPRAGRLLTAYPTQTHRGPTR